MRAPSFVRVFLLGLVVLALAVVAGFGAAGVVDSRALTGAPVVDDGTGTTRAQVQRLSVVNGDIALTTVQQICKTGFYDDGLVHARPCNTREFTGGFWWRSLHRLVWNPTVADGGHTDNFTKPCWHVGTGIHCGTSYVLDGETEWQGEDLTSGSDSTVWIKVFNAAGGYQPSACYAYYFAYDGGTNVIRCPS